MPIHEYVCEECGYTFEELILSSSDDEPVRCPKCGTKRTTKLMSAFSTAGSGGTSDYCGGSSGFS